MDLTISPPKWPQNRSSAVCQQNLRPIGSLFPSHTEYKAVHSGTVETRKRLGWHIQSVTSTRMEQDIVEPDFIILSVISQIYWRRWTQTVVLHRCLCQSLFSSNILLLFSKWKGSVDLVFSKVHIAPAKQHSIPRLELLVFLLERDAWTM